MRTSLALRIHCRDGTVARTIAAALAPDNVDFPTGQRLVMEQQGPMVLLTVSSTGSVASLLTTLDEILVHAELAADALGAAE